MVTLESTPSLVSPEGPVATLASLVSVDATANRISLAKYASANPGLTATVYSRIAATDCISSASFSPNQSCG